MLAERAPPFKLQEKKTDSCLIHDHVGNKRDHNKKHQKLMFTSPKISWGNNIYVWGQWGNVSYKDWINRETSNYCEKSLGIPLIACTANIHNKSESCHCAFAAAGCVSPKDAHRAFPSARLTYCFLESQRQCLLFIGPERLQAPRHGLLKVKMQPRESNTPGHLLDKHLSLPAVSDALSELVALV